LTFIFITFFNYVIGLSIRLPVPDKDWPFSADKYKQPTTV
jgi:hypothetical protein